MPFFTMLVCIWLQLHTIRLSICFRPCSVKRVLLSVHAESQLPVVWLGRWPSSICRNNSSAAGNLVMTC